MRNLYSYKTISRIIILCCLTFIYKQSEAYSDLEMPPCAPIGFENVFTPILCTGTPVPLTANAFTGADPFEDAFITPAFGIQITTDENSASENWLEIYDGPAGTGNRLFYWGPTDIGGNYLGQLPNNADFVGFGEFFSASGFYSFEWCDINGSGLFDYTVIDYSNNTILTTGSFNHLFGNCFQANIGTPAGTPTFSGIGVTDFGNGTGEFDPSFLPSGMYDITYSWDDGSGCTGTSTQTIEIVCTCPTVGFQDIEDDSPYDCNFSLISLAADNSIEAGGFITPGFTIELQTDDVSVLQNTLSLYSGPNGTGDQLAFYPVGTIPNNSLWEVIGEYFYPGSIFSFVYCDNQNDGIFSFNVRDHGSGNILSSGAILGANGCTTINFGPVTGGAVFSGPGVTSLGNGTGYIDPQIAGDGIHTITYTWIGTNCSGSATQDIEIFNCQTFSCNANAGTFSTPNGLVICYGDEFVMNTNWDFDGFFETGDFNDLPLPDGALGGPLDGIPDADGDGVNGVLYALYNGPPSTYIMQDQLSGNLYSIIGSAPDGLQGNGRILNDFGGNTTLYATTAFTFDEDLSSSGEAVVGFDEGGNGTIDCFDTNMNDIVQVTFLDEISAYESQVCNAFGTGVDITFTLTGGIPGFDNSDFIVFGSGGTAIVPNNGIYSILNHPFGAPFVVSINDNMGCNQLLTGNAFQPMASSAQSICLGAGGAVIPDAIGVTYNFNNHCFPNGSGNAPLPSEYQGACFSQGEDLEDHTAYFSIRMPAEGIPDLTMEIQNINMLNSDDVQLALYGPISNCPSAGGYPSLVSCFEGNSSEMITANGLQPDGLYLLVMDSKGDNTGSWEITLSVPPSISICPRVVLQGSINAFNSGPADLMRTTLVDNALIPLQQPYYASPWLHLGNESFNSVSEIPATMVDWVLVVIRDGQDPNVILGKAAGVLHSDGYVTDVNGNNILLGTASASGFYVEVIHRGHLPVISNAPLFPDGSNQICHDFTTGVTQAYVDPVLNDDPMAELMTLTGTYYGMYTGNVQQLDCQIDINDINLLFFNYNSNQYYGNADPNMDGQVDANDIFLVFQTFETVCHRPF
ncbi:MAG: hypothetical protein AAF502_12945 [Bacteroidota bacterium]